MVGIGGGRGSMCQGEGRDKPGMGYILPQLVVVVVVVVVVEVVVVVALVVVVEVGAARATTHKRKGHLLYIYRLPSVFSFGRDN